MALSKKTVNRLTKLIEFMESLSRSDSKHFYMGSYFRHEVKDGGHDHGLPKEAIVDRETLHLCGTSACALGWAATMPDFKEAGLRMNVAGDVFMRGEEPDITFSENTAASFFALEEGQSYHLFGSHQSIRTPKQWAKRARQFMKNEEDTLG